MTISHANMLINTKLDRYKSLIPSYNENKLKNLL
jgi:hypothetical protein